MVRLTPALMQTTGMDQQRYRTPFWGLRFPGAYES